MIQSLYCLGVLKGGLLDVILVTVQEGDNMVLRQSGEAGSGDLAHIYAVDTRHVVKLQFYPEGHEWAEPDPVLISEGFAGSRVMS